MQTQTTQPLPRYSQYTVRLMAPRVWRTLASATRALWPTFGNHRIYQLQPAETESAPNVIRLLSAETECRPKVPFYPHSAPKPKPKPKFGRPLMMNWIQTSRGLSTLVHVTDVWHLEGRNRLLLMLNDKRIYYPVDSHRHVSDGQERGGCSGGYWVERDICAGIPRYLREWILKCSLIPRDGREWSCYCRERSGVVLLALPLKWLQTFLRSMCLYDQLICAKSRLWTDNNRQLLETIYMHIVDGPPLFFNVAWYLTYFRHLSLHTAFRKS